MAASTARSLGLAIGVTVAGVAALFLASTWGVAALLQSRTPDSTGLATLPAVIENAPPSIGTTGEYGPPGRVSVVYAGTDVEEGLLDRLDRPWIAVTAGTGSYRALDAPRLPPPRAGALGVSPSGDRIAWATGDGVVVLDTVTGESRELPLDGADAVGDFAPEDRLLSVHADGLALLDLESGEVVAAAAGPDADVVRRAAWRADGSAVDAPVGEDLLTLPVDGSEAVTADSPFAADATLAWSPAGDRLVALVTGEDGNLGLAASPSGRDGALGPAQPVDTSGVSVQSLLGFSGEATVAVRAFRLESGSLERIVDIRLDGGSPTSLASLPRAGVNWQDGATLAASTEALRAGSSDFGDRQWPWSYRARLVACSVAGLFLLGLWLTRRRRTRRRRARA